MVKSGKIHPRQPQLLTLVQQFTVSNKVEGKSPKTIDWYQDLLTQFLTYLSDNHFKGDLSTFNMNTARDYVLSLQQRNKYCIYPSSKSVKLSAFTVQCHTRTLKAFSSWLYREGLTSENRLMNLRLPKAPKKLIEPLTPAEKKKMLRSIDKNSPVGMRDFVIIGLMLDTGLRASEVCSLQLNQLNLDKGYVKVLGKGSKERLVPVGEYTRTIFLRYIKTCRPKPSEKNSGAVFLSKDGKQMSLNALKLMFRRLARISKIERLHAHLLRHTFSTDYILAGGDIFSLQQILGHTTFEMVNQYLHFSTSQMTVQHHKFSPMDRLKGLKNEYL